MMKISTLMGGLIILVFAGLAGATVLFFNQGEEIEELEGKDCAKEGENFSQVFDDYHEKCCEGLTEWESGMDTRISVEDNCYDTMMDSGSPVGTCINCGNETCEEIEDPCNCPTDCVGKSKSDYNTVEEFCEEGYSKHCDLALSNIQTSELELCKLCAGVASVPDENILKTDIQQEGTSSKIIVSVENCPNEVDAFGFDVKFEGEAQYLEYSRGDLINDFEFFETNDLGDNTIRIGAFTTKGAIPKDASGNMVILEFNNIITSAQIINPVDDVKSWVK